MWKGKGGPSHLQGGVIVMGEQTEIAEKNNVGIKRIV